jgi:hypothetical protein
MTVIWVHPTSPSWITLVCIWCFDLRMFFLAVMSHSVMLHPCMLWCSASQPVINQSSVSQSVISHQSSSVLQRGIASPGLHNDAHRASKEGTQSSVINHESHQSYQLSRSWRLLPQASLIKCLQSSSQFVRVQVRFSMSMNGVIECLTTIWVFMVEQQC